MLEQQRAKEIENKRLAFIEQQRAKEIENKRIDKAKKDTLESSLAVGACVGIGFYSLWQIAKWGAATAVAPATGGASWSWAALTP